MEGSLGGDESALHLDYGGYTVACICQNPLSSIPYKK